jgi:sugar phosphate isomerase/epimerase
MAHSNRPVLVSVAQYMDELESGAMTVFDVIDAAHRLGADGVELRREVWANCEAEIQTARARIEELGLIVTFATHSTLFNANEAGHERMRQDIDLAAALGSPLFRVFQGPAPTDDDEAGWAVGQAAINHAAFLGVTIALENYAGMPGGKLAEIKRVLDRFPAPALETNIDIGNYTKHNQDVVEAINSLGARTIYAHLKDIGQPDGDLTYLGGGTLPMRDILDALDRLPQQIIYCFEFRGGGDPDGRIEKSIAYLRARGA